LQLFVEIACTGWTDEAKACVVDDKLRLSALREQRLVDALRGTGLQKIQDNDDWPARTARRDVVSQ